MAYNSFNLFSTSSPPPPNDISLFLPPISSFSTDTLEFSSVKREDTSNRNEDQEMKINKLKEELKMLQQKKGQHLRHVHEMYGKLINKIKNQEFRHCEMIESYLDGWIDKISQQLNGCPNVCAMTSENDQDYVISDTMIADLIRYCNASFQLNEAKKDYSDITDKENESATSSDDKQRPSISPKEMDKEPFFLMDKALPEGHLGHLKYYNAHHDASDITNVWHPKELQEWLNPRICDSASKENEYDHDLTFQFHSMKQEDEEALKLKQESDSIDSKTKCEMKMEDESEFEKFNDPNNFHEYLFRCKQCNKILRTENSLRGHSKLHKTTKMYQCKLCPMAYVNKGSLKAHEDIKHFPGIKINFVSQTIFLHFLIINFLLLSEITLQTEKLKFECSYCKRRFYCGSALAVHVVTHTGVNPYKCNKCHKGFSYEKTWQNHKRRGCNYSFSFSEINVKKESNGDDKVKDEEKGKVKTEMITIKQECDHQ
ncbi:hypothetical protein RFI_14152 [Reticulomyxa filosa]|uniref:C2H2-type domain-containing protein n=1 Tax=Reticulomyxa filosa TaxID=46433 RepID=X6NAH9_RETFI|nr:hypothetical protein RFI_14152 [Reticulomyxa filosa]|eukprot:ETO23036.1 hypothetical protein RFI_14152 [Reticulomyxa filosa]